MEFCVARPHLLRCVGCFVFPFLALAAYAYKVQSVGVPDVQSFVSSLAVGGKNAVSALCVFGGLLAWVLVTWPKARAALDSGPCTIGVRDGRLLFYGEAVELTDVADVEVLKRPFNIQLRVRRKSGFDLCKSITLLSPSPDEILTALQAKL